MEHLNGQNLALTVLEKARFYTQNLALTVLYVPYLLGVWRWISATALKKACRVLGVERWSANPSHPSELKKVLRSFT